jgi:hypothetical protein
MGRPTQGGLTLVNAREIPDADIIVIDNRAQRVPVGCLAASPARSSGTPRPACSSSR